ncbi:Copia protein, partial [Mucuna pruriens]
MSCKKNLISSKRMMYGNKSIIGTKWIFRNKLNQNGKIVRNKVKLVAQGYFQQEGIDFIETFASIARLEAIRRVSHLPPGCESDAFPNHIFKLKKTIYGLKQALCAWYDKLSSSLMTNGFQRGKVDTTLFRKNCNPHFIIMQIYIDDIIFCATNDSLCGEFSELQIKQAKDGIYIHQSKYVKELLKKFNLEN